MVIRTLETSDPLRDGAVQGIRETWHNAMVVGATVSPSSTDLPKMVNQAIDSVRRGGDVAVCDSTRELHQVSLTPAQLKVAAKDIAAARSAADGEFMKLLARAAENIRQYQRHILVKAPPPLVRGGRKLGVRYTPLDRVAVYVPGGRAIYPSTVLMTVVPAQVAGVREIVMVSPPTHNGSIHPLVLALAGELGVKEVIRAAGVAGLAATAFGTGTIRRVDKIVGPGNAFIAEAKRQLMGAVGIDSIAGPSEVLIVADDSANPAWLAADMLAQAEHDPGSAVLVTTSAAVAGATAAELDKQVGVLSRATAARAALEQYSAIIVVPSLEAACDVANDFATEHLQIVVRDQAKALGLIRHGGAIFLGANTPVPLGDYYAGPSHVLPTGGTARFFGPLSCNDFLKASSIVEYDARSLAEDSADVMKFAESEGLTAHASAIRKRLPQKED